jgi:predicted DCC family thiol-disulfide oxidoreductase YuxK
MQKMQHIVIFDGMCNLCSFTVQFIIKHERSTRLQFTSVQSPAGLRLMKTHGLDASNIETFVLCVGDHAYLRSEAAIRLAQYLRMPWRILKYLQIFPRFFLDAVYNFIAKNRYRWFGHRTFCMLPNAMDSSRFLTD